MCESWGSNEAWWHLQKWGPRFEPLFILTPASGLQSRHGRQVCLVPTLSQMTWLLIPDDKFSLKCDSFSKFLGDRLDPQPAERYILDLFTTVTDTQKARNSPCGPRATGNGDRIVGSGDAVCTRPWNRARACRRPPLGLGLSDHSTSFNDFYWVLTSCVGCKVTCDKHSRTLQWIHFLNKVS